MATLTATPTTLYDLAVDVFLFLVGFQRRIADGDRPSYHDTREEVLRLLGDVEERSHVEPGLWNQWTRGRSALIYLIDEVMILNCPWDHRQTWEHEPLEVLLLTSQTGQTAALGGDQFFRDCDQVMKELEDAERAGRHDLTGLQDLLTIYYIALQLGFKGRMAIEENQLSEYKNRLFNRLPAYQQTRIRQLFPEAEQHTIRMDPNYEPITRLLYVFFAFATVAAFYLLFTWGWWNSMIDVLAGLATEPKTDGK